MPNMDRIRKEKWSYQAESTLAVVGFSIGATSLQSLPAFVGPFYGGGRYI